jgi:hypothetical protein
MTELNSSKDLFDLLKAYSDGTPKSIRSVAKVIIASSILASAKEELGSTEVQTIESRVFELFDNHYQNGETGVTPALVESLLKASTNNEVAKIKYDLKEAKGVK